MADDPKKAAAKAPAPLPHTPLPHTWTLPESLPSIYFNGSLNTLSNGDITSTLLVDGRPVAKIHMSFTMAKTMSKLLGELVDRLERATGQEIMTTNVIDEGLKKLKKEDEAKEQK